MGDKSDLNVGIFHIDQTRQKKQSSLHRENGGGMLGMEGPKSCLTPLLGAL